MPRLLHHISVRYRNRDCFWLISRKSIPIPPQLLLLSHPYTRYADDRRIPSCLGELRLAPSGTRWAKNGKYEYCHKFSNSKMSLKLPASTDFKLHKAPNRRV